MQQRYLTVVSLAIMAALAVAAKASAQENIQERVCNNHLVSVTPDGSVSRGTKQKLIEAVESGEAIRVGFGLGNGPTGGFFLTHWFEAVFLTVIADEVFTQTPIIHRQRPKHPDTDISFPNMSSRWVATLGTNGKLHSKWLQDEKVADFEVFSWWCLAD